MGGGSEEETESVHESESIQNVNRSPPGYCCDRVKGCLCIYHREESLSLTWWLFASVQAKHRLTGKDRRLSDLWRHHNRCAKDRFCVNSFTFFLKFTSSKAFAGSLTQTLANPPRHRLVLTLSAKMIASQGIHLTIASSRSCLDRCMLGGAVHPRDVPAVLEL